MKNSGNSLSGTVAIITATKFAVRGMTNVAALELGEHDIRVYAIVPGVTDPPMLGENSEETMTGLKAMIPMGRLGEASEVAHIAAFLASDAGSYISGAPTQHRTSAALTSRSTAASPASPNPPCRVRPR